MRRKVLVEILFICAVILLSTMILPISIANAEDTAGYYVENYGPLRIATTEEPACSGDHSYTADTLQTPDNPSSGTMLKALIWPPMGKSISSPITKVRVVTYIECIGGDYNSQSLEYRLYAYNMETGELTRKIHDDTWPPTGNTPTYFPLSYGLKTYDDTIICDTKKSTLGEKETLILLSICHHFGAKSRHTKYAAHFDTNDYPAYMEVFTSDGKSTKYYIHDSFTTPTVDDGGLLAYYPFNGNANDESGNGFHGTVYGATLTEDRFGNADNAFLFDNPTTIDTNRIVVTDSYGFNGGDTLESFTISSWFLPYMQSDECSYLLRFASTDGIGSLNFAAGKVVFGLRTFVAGTIDQNIQADASVDNWHHVAGTWDGSVMKLYVNGVFRDEATYPWTLSAPPTPIGNTVGANLNPDPNNPIHVCSFNGKIDEVRIYNRALTESEIKALYDEQEGGCGKITNWETKCQGAYSPGQRVGAEMEFENLMGGGYNFKGVIIIRSPTGEEYTNSEVEWVPSAPNPHGKFAAGDALYVTIPEGASAGNYDMKLELWNADTNTLCDETEWKEDLFTAEGNTCPMLSDGKVEPLEGDESTNFVFSVAYKDGDGDEPVGKHVRIIGFQGTNKVYDETKEMIRGSGDIKMGVTYSYSATLPAAEYCYYFYFSDGKCAAYLPEGGYPGFEGPNVNGVTTGNHPPTAIRMEPTPDSITIEPGDTQEFKVKAEDVDVEVHNNLKMIEWFVDDVRMETGAADGTSAEVCFTHTFENAGTFSVKATVYDEQMEEASVTWEVNVGEAPGRYTLKFEGYDFDIKSEVIMILKYGESVNLLEFLPSDGDSNANENWIDYTIDVTEDVTSGNNILGFVLQDNSDGGKVKNVRIFRNDELIYAFNPITEIKLYKLEYLLYEFDTNEIPVKIDWAGPITIEMYAPKEIEKGGGSTIRIIVKLPRSGEYPVIHQHGKIGICYSEKVDIASEPVLQIRQPDWDWDTYETFKLKKGCDLFGAAIEGAIGKLLGKYNPGAGVGLSVIKEAHKCEVSYAHGGPPASEEWKDINEYDIYDCVYDVGYCGLVGLDRINAFYPLKFNEVGEYKICAFVDLIYKYELLSQNKRIGKELVWTVKVIE